LDCHLLSWSVLKTKDAVEKEYSHVHEPIGLFNMNYNLLQGIQLFGEGFKENFTFNNEPDFRPTLNNAIIPVCRGQAFDLRKSCFFTQDNLAALCPARSFRVVSGYCF